MEKCVVITTLSDNLEVIKNIQNDLLNKHLVSGCQISEVKSTYWWNNEINESLEYKLELRTIEKLFNKIEMIIKELHNYELPEISYYEIKGSKEILNWINEYSKGNSKL